MSFFIGYRYVIIFDEKKIILLGLDQGIPQT